jgi:two-component system OmpR family sensor kinase
VLVDNALAHTPPGTTVTIVVESDNNSAMLTIADDGPGIPSEAQPHVFERFFRLEGTVAAGSGLGLAIAREVAGLMDGRIELASRGRATRFTLVLPADAFGSAPEAGMRGVEDSHARASRRIAQV